MSFLLISFSPRFRRVTPIPSLDPFSTAAASSSSSHYLFFLFLVSFFVRWVLLLRFCFWHGPIAPISLCPTEGIVSPPVRAGFRGKVRGPPQGRPREANSRARRRSSSRCSFDAAANCAPCLPRFFISLARISFLFLSVCQVSLLR